jgi:hypothetical protein
VLAAAGYAIARSAGDISYLELVVKGKDMASANLPAIVGGAVALALAHILISRLVMSGKSAD